MENQGQWKCIFRNWTRSVIVLLVGAILWIPSIAIGMELYQGGDWDVSLDTTVSYGLLWRVEDRDPGIVGIANGGEAYSVNYDDGNLNYDTGLVSNALKITSELDIKGRQFGAFVRGSAFYDFEVMDGDTERTELSDDAEDAVGRSADLLDAYLWGDYEFGAIPVQVRLGEQVVSWGESTFIGGAINAINPVDVSKIRVPGAELKEALVPEGMIWASVGATENITVEGLYLYDWEETKIDEPGTYFSAADYVGDGGYKLLLGSGKVPDGGNAPVEDTFFAAYRDPTKEADDQGQFGGAMRALVPALKYMEFGFYYLHYHARIPRLTVRTGTADGLANAKIDAVKAAGAVYANAGVAPGADPDVDAAAQTAGTAAAIDTYVKSGGYYTEYVEDLNLFGVSFSTELFGFGWQGEVSYRPDFPIQIDDAELLLAMLAPLNPAIGALSQVDPGGINEQLDGYIERDQYQVQTTFSRILNPSFLGNDSGVILGEIGWVHVAGMPDKDELRCEVSPSYTPGDATAAAALGVPATVSGDFADADSWGYQLLFKLNYFNAIGAVTLSPRLGWAHDVAGNSPFGGPFLEGRKAITLGLGAQYQSWTADLSYTSYSGNEEQNLRHDRDFVGFNIKYFF